MTKLVLVSTRTTTTAVVPPLLLFLLFLTTSRTAQAYLKYNQVRQKDAHNSYERREGLLDQLFYHQIRTIEIDAHLGFTKGLYSVHHDAGLFQSYSSFNRLRDGILLLQEFHAMVPNHHVVTVFMDLKGRFKDDLHTPENFDSVIGQLPLWTPQDAQGNASSIRAGIDEHGWPELEELRGKFIWVLTHGQVEYCSSNAVCVTRKSFVADVITSLEELGRHDYMVFYNQNMILGGHLGPDILRAGYVGRVWHPEDINTRLKWFQAEELQFQHITSDRVNYHQDTFSKTHNAHGYPFQSLNGVDVSNFTLADEGADVIYMYASPGDGDAWGRVDNGHFAYSHVLVNQTDAVYQVEYTTSVSLVNSYCERFAKAGIMLRQEDPRFPLGSGQYFAVMRPCREMIRVQYRERAYMLTVGQRLTPTLRDGIEQAKRIGIKVKYTYDGKDSHCEGYFKLEGHPSDQDDSYILIHKQTFPNVQLTLHGFFVSSHYWQGNSDGTSFKALFINTKQNNRTVTAETFARRYGNEDPEAFGNGYFPDSNGSRLGNTIVGNARRFEDAARQLRLMRRKGH